VIDVGVAEDDCLQSVRLKSERKAIPFVALWSPLDEAAIQEEASTVGLNLVTGAGDFPGSSVKGDLKHGRSFGEG
jgi:hypothetical protein